MLWEDQLANLSNVCLYPIHNFSPCMLFYSLQEHRRRTKVHGVTLEMST